MKNGKMIAMVFSVMVSTAAIADAQVAVDFDGKTGKSFNLTETLRAADTVNSASISPEAAGIAGRKTPEFTAEQVVEMDKTIGTAIAYVLENKQPVELAQGFACLLVKGTPEQKATFSYAAKSGPYTFPAACKSQDKLVTDAICRWVTKKVCETVFENGSAKLVCTMLSQEVCI